MTAASDDNAETRRAEICVVACADAFAGHDEILVSPMGLIPMVAARLAKLTSAPHCLLSDGEGLIVENILPLNADPSEKEVGGYLPFRNIFDVVWSGKRHVMMGATQIDRFGNQNISCIGTWDQPKVQLLGVRGAPGNTVNHLTSYWIPNHNARVFVTDVDVVSGVGPNRIPKEEPPKGHLKRVVSNLGVFDCSTENGHMQIVSLHPGVNLSEVLDATDFQFQHADKIAVTRFPTAEERALIRDQIDTEGKIYLEVPDER